MRKKRFEGKKRSKKKKKAFTAMTFWHDEDVCGGESKQKRKELGRFEKNLNVKTVFSGRITVGGRKVGAST